MATLAQSDVPRPVAKRRQKKARRRRLGARFASCLVFVLSYLPRPVALLMGRVVGSLAYHFASKDRRRALRQLQRALPELSRQERRAVIRRMFRHFAETTMDIIVLSRWGPERAYQKVPIEGWEEGSEVFLRALDEGKGAIALGAHFGNWELLAALMQLKFPGRLRPIARRYEEYGGLVETMRARLGLEMLYHDDSVRSILEVLRNNGILGILPDQDAKNVHGIFVDFFGRSAYTPSAPANFCNRVGCPLIPVFIVREGKGYRAIVREPIRREDVEGAEDPVLALTELWTRAFEEEIRKRPEQWVWTHKRWNTTQEVLDRRRAHDKIRRERGW